MEAQVYHVWFATRKRKWLLQGDVEQAIESLLRKAAEDKGIRLLAQGTMVDHVHLLLELGQEEDLGKVMHLLKGLTARQVFQQFPELHLDAGLGHFWQRRYGHKLVPREAVKEVTAYIETQQARVDKYDRPAHQRNATPFRV